MTEQILREATDHDLPMIVWDSLIERVFGNYDSLTYEQQDFYLVEYLNFEIGNGGLVQYFANSRGGNVNETIAALGRMGAETHLAMFKEAVEIWEAERAILEPMLETIEGFSQSYEVSRLVELDDRWDDIAIEPFEVAFVRANAASFVVDSTGVPATPIDLVVGTRSEAGGRSADDRAVTPSEMADVPALELLAYHERTPRLRVLRLRDREAVAAPVSVKRANAIRAVVPRSTWMAFDLGEEVWAAPIPLTGAARRIAKSFDCVAALDPDHLWVEASTPVGRESREIDGLGTILRTLPVSEWGRIDACTPEGLVVRRIWQGPHERPGPWPLMLRDPDTGSERELSDLNTVSAAFGSRLLLSHFGQRIVLVDLAADTAIEIENPGIARWQMFPSFSPDGSQVAIGADLLPPGPQVPITAIFEPGYKSAPKPSVLVLIDTATGDTTIVDGQFENFATTPTWSRDGEWLVFDAPFEHNQLHLLRLGEERLRTIEFPGTTVVPLLDVTGTPILGTHAAP